jgi:ATP-binding cassette, subfamily C (CFTR/MRP), member 1
VQNTIRTQFANMTVLTIAHRIHTILDYDRIVVMENGKVLELDTPKALLMSPNSVFYSLVHEAQQK